MIGIDDDIGVDESSPLKDESDKTISLMGGVARPEGLPEADLELQALKGPNKLLGQGSLLLVGVFVIAAGALWAMRVGQGDLKSSEHMKAIEAKVEVALATIGNPKAMVTTNPLLPKNLKALLDDTDEILAIFDTDPTKQQVPVDQVKKNPFVIKQTKSSRPEVAPKKAPDKPREDPLKKLREELSKYVLQSVILGAHPVAVINGGFLQPGQKLGSFTVTEIHSQNVSLTAQGQTFTLEMKNDAGGTPSRRRK